MKKTSEKIPEWIIFITLSIIVIYTLFLGIQNSLKMTGIEISEDSIFTIIILSGSLWWLISLYSKLKKRRINNYFKIAVVLSWIVLFVGFTLFSDMYKSEFPLLVSPISTNGEDLNKLTNNMTNPSIFSNLVCISKYNRNYLSEWDILECNITTNLSKSEYNFSIGDYYKFTKNQTQEKDNIFCSGKELCRVILYTKDDSFAFQIIPAYSNGTDKIKPIDYYFEVKKLRNWKDLENLEQNKITLLIAIITASFLTVWAGVYYAKKILEND
ncbi:MAG: hypothetical protein WC867_08075 [Candidatus Pacearchaeota archaeon]|jgi:hypothetical protein